MKHITSAANALYRNLLKLSESSRERRKQRLTLIDGVHLLDAYLRHGGKLREVIVLESATERPEIVALTRRLAAPPVSLADRLFDELTELRSRSGILAAIQIPAQRTESANGLWLLLEDIQDPGNLGSILRTAEAAGVSDVWLSKGCADAWSPKVLRAAMGAHFGIGIHERSDLVKAALRRSGRVVAMLAGAPRSIYDIDLTGALSIALGNEGAGLSTALLEAATEHGAIPMRGHAESLNVAAAAAISLFECVRQLTANPAQ